MNFVRSSFDFDYEQDFLPQGCLEKLITRASVLKTVERDEIDPGLLNFITNSAKKVFAITVLCGWEGRRLYLVMEKFREDGFHDKSLPVKTASGLSSISCFKRWTKATRLHFIKCQWKFLVPIFPRVRSKADLHLNLDPQCILPFTSAKRSGTFGNIYQVTIHPDHQEDPMRKVLRELQAASGMDDETRYMREDWRQEARALEDIIDLDHPHIMQVKAIITRGTSHYAMFQWADGGSLRDFYQSTRRPNLNAAFVREIITQLYGLAGALSKLHYYKGKGSYRHGDLKPENILRFKDKTQIGILKIADMGLRGRPIVSRYGTRAYAPPEVMTMTGAHGSRLYDIWSMGCICLELVVWLLYGCDTLRDFNNSLIIPPWNAGPYWLVDDAQVHPNVVACMDYIEEKDPECDRPSAISDLLEIVKTKLLIVLLPPESRSTSLNPTSPPSTQARQRSLPGPTFGSFRTTAPEFCSALESILENKDESYWYSGISRDRVAPMPINPKPWATPFTPEDLAGVDTQITDTVAGTTNIEGPIINVSPRDDTRELTEPLDNDFARYLFLNSELLECYPRARNVAKLCGRCQKMDFWAQPFRFKDNLQDLKRDATSCEFCEIRKALCENMNPALFRTVHFDRLDSMIRLNESHPPAFTVVRSPDIEMLGSMRPIQIGLPELPEAGGSHHLDIIRGWLRHCDQNHPNCRQPETTQLPTRLIDVGVSASLTIKLYETRPGDKLQYFALSHSWGKPPHFCTNVSNFEQHKQGINNSALPDTFRHAVAVTRELGVRYLWIDSLCIIQGDNGDFYQEAKQTGDVFSQAYCVLAASCATNQLDGFLKPRDKRKYLTFQREGQAPFYLCEFIDDFENHVLRSNLNQRGWILQERALARRTIYFTQKQTYWECGDGVRCETMTKMNNTLASFLGDPSFPKVAIESLRGGKILLYQDLYRKYSRLAFTHQQDRPIAIAGLESRLIQSFGVRGGFGVFDDKRGSGLLRRSLLWHRSSDVERLDRISMPAGRMPPSWSWMAYKGGIDYFDLPLNGVEWEGDEIRSPWAPSDTEAWHTADAAGAAELSAVARDFNSSFTLGKDTAIIYDDPARRYGPALSTKCVVLGRQKTSDQNGLFGRHYVMVVIRNTLQVARGDVVYERVGVGYLPGRMIQLSVAGTPGKIR
ncbi:hypothetical protein B0T10DRAFT_403476 [Thelonectria olida]|uniref:Protein kinase domain-containing protein n=1 Tax=Thelonectria olida TaxID=1576542 RepID=A0A9P9ATC9_9HYPO|nr:hypothetical protein B0T10DRAFT_403476 [Thelonectria olida]